MGLLSVATSKADKTDSPQMRVRASSTRRPSGRPRRVNEQGVWSEVGLGCILRQLPCKSRLIQILGMRYLVFLQRLEQLWRRHFAVEYLPKRCGRSVDERRQGSSHRNSRGLSFAVDDYRHGRTTAATPAMHSFSPSLPHSRWKHLPYREEHESPGRPAFSFPFRSSQAVVRTWVR